MSRDADSSELPVRVMALHALAYCERLFYLEEVEEIRVADERVYAGRTLHEELGEGEERSTFNLESEALGLVGRLDAVRHRDGSWTPVEHKRGRAFRHADGPAAAWPSDALQVSAYGLLLEEHAGAGVAEGRVRYHADGVTVRVPLDAEARASVSRAVERARELRASTERPPVTPNENLCIRCSLAPVCLPEEERLAGDDAWEPVRLFPPDHEGADLHVTNPGTRIGRSGEQLYVDAPGEERRTYPINSLRSVSIHGYAQLSAQALHAAASKGVSLHWFSGGGRYVGALAAGPGPVQRRIRQYRALVDPEFRLGLAGRLVHARAEGQLRYLLRATRGSKPRPKAVIEAVASIRAALKECPGAGAVDSLRGYEGSAARAWYSAIGCLLGSEVPDELRPAGRSRRPPRDRFNALLSFGYSLLHRSVLEAVLVVGLEPAFGFYHTPRSSAPPLVLDLMELFRLPVWDVPLIGSINRRQWDPQADFTATGPAVWLSDAGRRKAIALFERRLEEKWKHPITDYSLSYARTIELEVRLLEKEWTGRPGLFARARLR